MDDDQDLRAGSADSSGPPPRQEESLLLYSRATSLSELQPGDILLYHGCDPFARAIQCYDSTPYYHAALLLEDLQVAEAVMTEGISSRPLIETFQHREWAMVRRRRYAADGAPFDVMPVLRAAQDAVEDGPRYAAEQLLPLALLLISRKRSSNAAWERTVVGVLEASMDWLRRRQAAKESTPHLPMVCSGFVAHCLANAPAPAGETSQLPETQRPSGPARIDPESLLFELARRPPTRRWTGSRRRRYVESPESGPSLDALAGQLAALLDEPVTADNHVRRPIHSGFEPAPEEVQEAVEEFARVLVGRFGLEDEAKSRGLADALATAARFAERLVTPGDLGRRQDLMDIGVLHPQRWETPSALRPETSHTGPGIDRIPVESLLTPRASSDRTAPWLWTPVERRAASPDAGATGLVSRHVSVASPRHIWLRTPSFPVVVRVSLLPAGPGGALILAHAGRSLWVRLSAPAFEILTDAEQTTAILRDRDSTPVVFELQPRQAGPTRLQFDFVEGGHPLGTLDVPIDVLFDPADKAPGPQTTSELKLSSGADPIDLILLITLEDFGKGTALKHTLIRRDGGVRTFVPVPLQGDVAAYAERIYSGLSALNAGVDPTAASLRQRSPVAPEDVDRRLRRICEVLWDELTSSEFKDYYQTQRHDQGIFRRDQSVLILSDEPALPWELLWPYDPDGNWDEDEPWCLRFRLTRWLRRDFQGNGADAPPSSAKLQRMALIAPDTRLAGAAKEKRSLLALITALGIEDVSPSRATWSAMMDLLEDAKTGCDWFHVAGHGTFRPLSPGAEAAVFLEDGGVWTPDHIAGLTETRMLKRHPAFIFNACEVGQQAPGLTRAAGWANRLVKCGASLFVAPLWEVHDESAFRFVEELYERLLSQSTAFGEALRQARLAVRRSGDPTWLAYVAFAHPNGRVFVGRTTRAAPSEHP